jgi:hypothetical protein
VTREGQGRNRPLPFLAALPLVLGGGVFSALYLRKQGTPLLGASVLGGWLSFVLAYLWATDRAGVKLFSPRTSTSPAKAKLALSTGITIALVTVVLLLIFAREGCRAT